MTIASTVRVATSRPHPQHPRPVSRWEPFNVFTQIHNTNGTWSGKLYLKPSDVERPREYDKENISPAPKSPIPALEVHLTDVSIDQAFPAQPSASVPPNMDNDVPSQSNGPDLEAQVELLKGELVFERGFSKILSCLLAKAQKELLSSTEQNAKLEGEFLELSIKNSVLENHLMELTNELNTKADVDLLEAEEGRRGGTD